MITDRDFYADPDLGLDRTLSGEVDFGVMWTDGARRWPQWRVSWVEATGEVYAVELGPPRRDGYRLQLLGRAPTRSAIEGRMAGWAELPDARLDWVRARLEASAPGRMIH